MKYIQEDFEFYQTKDGKVGVDKVITITSKSGKAFNDGTANGGDTSQAVKRVPFQKMSQDDKDLAKAAYKALKQNGSIDDVDKKFKTSPRPDVVMKSDGAHADIYYDSNKDGEPDEKDVRIAASRKRTLYQKSHSIKESTYKKPNLHESNEVCLAAARDLIDADDIGDAITDACGAGGASDYKNLILDLQSGKFALVIGEADAIADELYDAGYDAEAEELADIIAPVRQLSESHRK